MTAADGAQRERLRQQLLLRALWQGAGETPLAGWLREPALRAAQGLSAYRGNAAAIAERALSAAFPTVRELIGEESFALLARAYWHREPPRCGDLAHYGDGLADWIARDEQLASEPYLADVARVDWAVHTIEQAADVATPPPGLWRLGECEPSQLTLQLRPGLTLVASRFPVVTIWQAHRRSDADRFAPVRAAFADRVAETALIARPQWQAVVGALDEAGARFMRALQAGADLARALDAAGAAFRFEPWLHDAVRQQWLQAVLPVRATSSAAMR